MVEDVLAVTGFWLFHISLMSSNTTTIEHCEKRRSEDTAKVSPYNLSIWQNFKGALGKNPMFWMLPICYRSSDEDGINFRTRFDFQ
mmetsp:Transcript_7559/g.14082  ORF Transcript_7559/g.14082 Transcript_7559/m.14082 type:complete len:86 (+) Transcript_7559:39-296(+)